MAIVLLKNTIKDIIENSLSIPYYRLTKPDANLKMAVTEADGPFAVHLDQTTVSTNQSQNGGFRLKEIPTEILFISKEVTTDDDLDTNDALVDTAEQLADRFFDLMIQSGVVSDLVDTPSYDLERAEAYKELDLIATGVKFICTFSVDQNIYYCNGN